MKILHVASIKNNPFNGVCVAVPQHIIHQSELAEVALLNIIDCKIIGIEHQYVYHKKWKNDVEDQFKNPDIVLFHEVYHIEFAQIARDLVKEGIPYVIVPHGSLVAEAQKQKWWKKKIANLLLFNAFIEKCEAIQCLSVNEEKNTLFNVSSFIGTNGVEIPNNSKTSFRNEGLKIVYIGRLETHSKGLDLLIETIYSLKSLLIKNKVTIDLYGPDNIKEWFEALRNTIIEKKLECFVCLHHAITGEEKKKVLLDSDLFIQTSRHEGMPMGILEAMSYGVPCLITEGTSLGDIVREYNAGWVAETNQESIILTLKRVLEEKDLLNNKSAQARKLVMENYSWAKTSNCAVLEYENLINHKHSEILQK